MVYKLVYIGGPRDGAEVWSLRPLDTIFEPDGSVYATKMRGDACLEWLADDERLIRMSYVGKGVEVYAAQSSRD